MVHPANNRSSLTRIAAQSALALGRTTIEEPLREKVSLVLLDFLGCCMEAARSEAGRRMLAYAGKSADGSGAEVEALTYGMLGHALIREDMHVPSGTHPGVVILPAMLALARRERLTGEAFVRGVVAGYHVMGALGIAARTGLKNRHFRPLGISGPFGATAGALAATGSGEEMAVNALAFAANFASGLNQWPWSGGQEIYVHAGMAARNALVALDLGRAGLRASPDILEGGDGLFNALGSGPEAAAVFLERLAGPSCLLEVTHKPAAGCNYVQTAAAAALELRKRSGASGTQEIRRIVISTFSAARSYPGCDSAGPFEHLEQRKMSFQYVICAALRFGRLDGESYSRFTDSELLRLIATTELRVDEGFERRTFPAQPARVELAMQDGTTVVHELPDVPWLNPQDIRLRFETQASESLSRVDGRKLTALVSTLWDQPDLSELFALLDMTRSA
jgi:2-methylcitrate dehydratase PrpD